VLTFKYKLTTTTTIIVVVVVSCSSPLSLAPHRRLSSLVIGLYRLCPFMGTGRRLWAVVGDGCGPWWLCGSGYGRWRSLCSFWRVRCRFRAVVLVYGRSSSIEVRWSRRGGSADVGRGRRVLFVAVVSLVWWWCWLKKTSHVTSCDRCIMYKHAREITYR
jgi:hypothetical protein